MQKITLRFVSFLIIVSLSGTAFGTPLMLIEEKIKKITAFSCYFTQENFDSFQDKTTYSKGQMTFKQPGLMRWHYSDPDESLIVIGHEFVWVHDPILENVTIQQLDKIAGINSLQFLSEKRKLRNHFLEITPKQVFIDTNPKYVSVFLAPKKEQEGFSELQLSFEKHSHKIAQLVIIDQNGNYRKITFNRMVDNPPINESDFEFQVTEDMEVIKGIHN